MLLINNCRDPGDIQIVCIEEWKKKLTLNMQHYFVPKIMETEKSSDAKSFPKYKPNIFEM